MSEQTLPVPEGEQPADQDLEGDEVAEDLEGNVPDEPEDSYQGQDEGDSGTDQEPVPTAAEEQGAES